MKGFVDYCEQLREIGWHVPDGLMVGSDLRVIHHRFAAQGLDPRNFHEAVQFLELQDGVSDQSLTLDQMQLLPGFYPLSLAEASDMFEQLKSSPHWNQGLFPLFADGMGFYIAVRENDNTHQSNAVFELIEGYLPALVFASVEDMFRTYSEATRQGIVFIDQGRYLEVDRNRFRDVAATINPNIEFWKT